MDLKQNNITMMIKSVIKILILNFTVSIALTTPVFAQDIDYTSKQGLDWIGQDNYSEAQKAFSYLVKKYPKDSKYNYYLGICLLKTRSDVSQAVKRLNLARIKRVSKEAYYYLGRAHQLLYHFDEAIRNYEKYISITTKADEKKDKAKIYVAESKNGKKIALKIYGLSVLDKEHIQKNELLKHYTPANDVGHLYKNSDFFESGVNPNHIMFETERGDVVYFSMKENDVDTLSIYKMEKLIDGWGDNKTLGEPVNSPYNDAYPFLATDGLTFYFASDRPGGFGGYDIYKVFYDAETQSFLEPINLGVPFNSPDDDYLFVSDEFNKIAWFASNRETYGDSLYVYTIKWDGKQVRNMVRDANEILEAAKLKIAKRGSDLGSKAQQAARNNYLKRNENKDLFKFEINDTIIYTTFENFINPEAQKLFKEGFKMQTQKDSLALDMKVKRNDYARTNNEQDRNELVNEILRLENKVYSLEDFIEEKYIYARQKEIYTIHDLVKQGVYKPKEETISKEGSAILLDGILIPEKFSMYTSEEFERIAHKNSKLYAKLFSDNDVRTLKYADSLYVWANILNLESSQLLANSNRVEEENNVRISDFIKKVRGEEVEEPVSNGETMIRESKELKILSTRIYHKALDKKYPVYWLKLKDISSKVNQDSEVNDLIYQGNAYFREAKNLLNEFGGMSIESFEKSGALKRAGIESHENALNLYGEMLESNPDLASAKTKGRVQKSYSELQKGSDAYDYKNKKEENKNKVAEKTNTIKPEEKKSVTKIVKEEYRVQIGVFRNEPNVDVLAKLPQISSLELEGRGLTKYFSGKFNTKEEALKLVPEVIKAGFSGAFVVYFKNGKLSSLPKN